MAKIKRETMLGSKTLSTWFEWRGTNVDMSFEDRLIRNRGSYDDFPSDLSGSLRGNVVEDNKLRLPYADLDDVDED